LRATGLLLLTRLARRQNNRAMRRDDLIQDLVNSENPSIRWKVRIGVLDEDPTSRAIKRLQQQIRESPLVAALLARRDDDGHIHARYNVYDKWHGAHWVLAALADLGYPPHDESLFPLRDQVLSHWLKDQFYREFDAGSRAQAYKRPGVPVMQGRYRRCASQQGNALLAATRLGLLDDRADRLVERLLHWQWPDGGWNCDKNPSADTSSFMETLLPMRGLAAYARHEGDAGALCAKAQRAARKAADVFLTRRLFKRRADGSVIAQGFTALHYPVYWHYDILAGLKAMAELDLIRTPRCADALDLLEAKELESGGWAADDRYFKTTSKPVLGGDYVNWGSSRKSMNEWITTDALSVLHAAGRL